MDRKILRSKAKKEYKELIKKVPKNQRPSFSDFFANIQLHLKKKKAGLAPELKKQAETINLDDENLLDDMIVELPNDQAE